MPLNKAGSESWKIPICNYCSIVGAPISLRSIANRYRMQNPHKMISIGFSRAFNVLLRYGMRPPAFLSSLGGQKARSSRSKRKGGTPVILGMVLAAIGLVSGGESVAQQQDNCFEAGNLAIGGGGSRHRNVQHGTGGHQHCHGSAWRVLCVYAIALGPQPLVALHTARATACDPVAFQYGLRQQQRCGWTCAE